MAKLDTISGSECEVYLWKNEIQLSLTTHFDCGEVYQTVYVDKEELKSVIRMLEEENDREVS
jgi:hypothetical protein